MLKKTKVVSPLHIIMAIHVFRNDRVLQTIPGIDEEDVEMQNQSLPRLLSTFTYIHPYFA